MTLDHSFLYGLTAGIMNMRQGRGLAIVLAAILAAMAWFVYRVSMSQVL
jgi:hypothetical protein